MIRTVLAFFLIASLLPGEVKSTTLPCRLTDRMEWDILTSEDGRTNLDGWCLTVGPPAFALGKSSAGEIHKIVLVSWNVNVGGGNLDAFLEALRAEQGIGPDVGIIVLLQEAYRRGADVVPASYPRDIRVPKAIRPTPRTADILGIADRFGMSAVYVPSMRNGREGSEDRGNAILSTEPVDQCRALEMPFGKQRRVALTCIVRPRGSPNSFRVVSLHLDTNGDRKKQADALAKALRPIGKEPALLMAAGDLNSLLGRHDGSYQALHAVLPEKFCGNGHTEFWPLRLDLLFGWWRGRIDFMFSNDTGQGQIRLGKCQTIHDRRGSDHTPLRLSLELNTPSSVN